MQLQQLSADVDAKEGLIPLIALMTFLKSLPEPLTNAAMLQPCCLLGPGLAATVRHLVKLQTSLPVLVDRMPAAAFPDTPLVTAAQLLQRSFAAVPTSLITAASAGDFCA